MRCQLNGVEAGQSGGSVNVGNGGTVQLRCFYVMTCPGESIYQRDLCTGSFTAATTNKTPWQNAISWNPGKIGGGKTLIGQMIDVGGTPGNGICEPCEDQNGPYYNIVCAAGISDCTGGAPSTSGAGASSAGPGTSGAGASSAAAGGGGVWSDQCVADNASTGVICEIDKDCGDVSTKSCKLELVHEEEIFSNAC
jgi:hypothetical protein